LGIDSFTLEKAPVKKKYDQKRCHICDEPSCGREYYSKADLADHKRGAHGADKLKCPDSNCPASYTTSSALSGHMWVKHDIGKGPKCDQCGRKESSVQNLKNHKRAAHGAPKLLCKEPGCTKAFTYTMVMYNHMKKKHK